MSAVTTGGKPGHGTNLARGFPTSFTEAYNLKNYKPKYFGESIAIKNSFWRDDNSIWGKWHEQKRVDAVRRATNATKDTKSAEIRYLTSKSGYHLPKPVNVVKYANPSFGALILNSAKAESGLNGFSGGGGELSGGVLRSAEGQLYGKKLLLDRIRQLNAIQAELDGQPEGDKGVPLEEETGKMNEKELKLIELSQLFAEVFNSFDSISEEMMENIDDNPEELKNYVAGISSNYKILTKILSILLQLGPALDLSELQNINDQLSQIDNNLLRNINSEALDGIVDGYSKESKKIESLTRLLTQMLGYIRIMVKSVNKSPEDKMAISNKAIRELKLSDKSISFYEPDVVLPSVSDVVKQYGEGRKRGKAREPKSAKFDTPAKPREYIAQKEAGVDRSRFDLDTKYKFGSNAGEYFDPSNNLWEAMEIKPKRKSVNPSTVPQAEKVEGAGNWRKGLHKLSGVFSKDTQNFDIRKN